MGNGLLIRGFGLKEGSDWGGRGMKGTWQRTHANIPQVFVEIRKEQPLKITSFGMYV
jgi:hypothetical protein